MKKILIVLLSAICILGISGKVSAADKTSLVLSQSFDTSQIPKEVTVGTSGKFSAPYKGNTQGYDLNIETIFSVSADESSILSVSPDGEWQALKPGTVELVYAFKIPQASLDKYPDLEISIQEICMVSTIEVKPKDDSGTPAVINVPVQSTSEPTVKIKEPSIAPTAPTATTTKPTPTAAPIGAVAKTNYKSKRLTSIAFTALSLSALTILSIIGYKIRKTI